MLIRREICLKLSVIIVPRVYREFKYHRVSDVNKKKRRKWSKGRLNECLLWLRFRGPPYARVPRSCRKSRIYSSLSDLKSIGRLSLRTFWSSNFGHDIEELREQSLLYFRALIRVKKKKM